MIAIYYFINLSIKTAYELNLNIKLSGIFYVVYGIYFNTNLMLFNVFYIFLNLRHGLHQLTTKLKFPLRVIFIRTLSASIFRMLRSKVC